MAKGIYCYIDKKNNQIVYVGKDSNIDKNKRHKNHLAPSNYNAQPINRILQNNPNRYIYRVLWEIDDCIDNHLNQMEIFCIKKYNPQFNFTEGGDGISGFKHSEETRRKMSESQKGKVPWNKGKINVYSEETRKKRSESGSKAQKGENNSMYGKVHSEETRKKMSENNARYWQGKTRSEETRKKMSESQKGKTLSVETRKKISEARNTTGFYRVHKHKNSNYKQGFTWRYKYQYKSTRKVISAVDLKKLEEEVRKEGLEWKVINKENSIKSIRENEM